MTTNSSCSFSSELVTYLIGEITPEEQSVFERHIPTCSSCQKDMEELQEAWSLIPFKLDDDVEVPSDLKEEVMNSIFQSEKALPAVKKAKMMKPSFYRWLAAVLFLALVGVSWHNIILRNQITENQSSMPAEMIQEYSLKSAGASEAQGNAWLYRKGDKKQLVFQIKGLEETEGTEAYQVWLIHEGKRKSAGVFRVDKEGNGFLTYEFNDKDSTFDTIGISLEPDANGTQPRGKKVLGT